MRLIDADMIIYSWMYDTDGKEHDGITLQSIIDKLPTVDTIFMSVIEDIKAEIKDLHNSHMIYFVSADGAVDTCLEIIDKHIADMRGAE